MALSSPGLELKETSLQTTVVNNSTGRAAIVGKFRWGPAFQPIQITQETTLVDYFGSPDDVTADYFLSSANFLNYGNDLRVVRVLNEEVAKNASAVAGNLDYTVTTAGSNYVVGDQVIVKYLDAVVEEAGVVSKVDADGKILAVYVPTANIVSKAKTLDQYPKLSDSWTIQVVSKSSGVAGVVTHKGIVEDSGIILTDATTAKDRIQNAKFTALITKYGVPGIVALYAGEIGDQIEVEVVSKADYAKGNTLQLPVYPAGGTQQSTVKSYVPYGPQTDDEYAIVVRKGGAVVESVVLSTKRGAKNIYGNNIFMDDYFENGGSNTIFATATGFPVGFSGVLKLSGGVSGNDTVTAGDFMLGWDQFADKESIYVNLLIASAVAGESIEIASTVQKYVVSIAESRRDCLVLASPPREIIVDKSPTRATDNLEDWKTATGAYETDNFNISSTRYVLDGNYKYQYDKYNDVNRWVPFGADIAGACVFTDQTEYPWKSPAGFKRGQMKNTIKLAVEMKQSHRDVLYELGINPIIGTRGEGFILYGDKSGTQEPTPFDRINVRRLFNMIEKSIGDSSKYRLFENNTAFVRNSFKLECTQYLDGIKTLGGIYDFRVVCDTTNNTDAVIDRNEFVATFYIKPSRSINYITLNFVATATGANFDELIGSVN